MCTCVEAQRHQRGPIASRWPCRRPAAQPTRRASRCPPSSMTRSWCSWCEREGRGGATGHYFGLGCRSGPQAGARPCAAVGSAPATCATRTHQPVCLPQGDILATAWHGCELGEVAKGESAAIWGAGPGALAGRVLSHCCSLPACSGFCQLAAARNNASVSLPAFQSVQRPADAAALR